MYDGSARLSRVFAILAAIVAGGVTSACVIGAWQAVLRTPNPSLPGLSMLIIAALLMALALIAGHESGHLLAGLAVGFRPWLVMIGPLKIVREGATLRVRLNRSLVPGLVRALPTDARDLRRRLAVYISGGPLASLLLGVLCLGLAIVANRTSTAITTWRQMGFWLGMIGLSSLILFLGTIIRFLAAALPFGSSGPRSDGAQLFDLLQGRPRAERRLLAMTLITAWQDGVRPRAWEVGIVERLLALREGTADDVGANICGFYYALDSGQSERAGRLLDLAVSQLQGYQVDAHPALLLEAAFFEARHRHNVAAARAWLEQAQGGHAERCTRLRAEAAILWAEGRYAEAAAKAEEGLAAIPRSVAHGSAVLEREWLDSILAESRRVRHGGTTEPMT
jgi:hypothetical protein